MKIGKLWRPIDWCGIELAERWTPVYQIRTGVIMTVMALGYFAAYPFFFRSESFGIFTMSAFALLFSGPATTAVGILAMSKQQLEKLKNGEYE